MKKYETKDFYLATLLESNGFRLIGSHKNPEGVYFEFEVSDNELLYKTIQNFVNCTAVVNIKRFTSSMAHLRKEIDKYKQYKRA